MVLSVSEILNGIEDYKEVTIESINDTVFLRPLSKAEWDKVQSIRQESLGDYVSNEKAKATSRKKRIAQMESKLSFNIKENSEADSRASIEAVYMSMNNPGYDEKPKKQEIEMLPPGVFDEIYDKVLEISGVSTDLEEEVDEFPENG